MAGRNYRAAAVVLMIMVAGGLSLDVCKACDVCGDTPSTPVYKAPPYKSPKAPPTSGGGGGGGKTPPTSGGGGKAPRSGSSSKYCPVALVKLGVCSPLLGGVVGGLLPASSGCCALLNLLGVDVEVCLCLAVDANILGLISIDAKVDAVVSILTSCGYKIPTKFSCPRY